jgi:hypothetical protein
MVFYNTVEGEKQAQLFQEKDWEDPETNELVFPSRNP